MAESILSKATQVTAAQDAAIPLDTMKSWDMVSRHINQKSCKTTVVSPLGGTAVAFFV